MVVDGQEHWEVAKVLESKYIRGKLHYHFLWTGFEDDNAEQRAWQPAENATGALEAVAEFHRRHPEADGPEMHRPRRSTTPGESSQPRTTCSSPSQPSTQPSQGKSRRPPLPQRR